MAGMMEMVKQATQMRKQMKEMQKQLAKQKVEFESGGIKVVALGDMTVQSITIDPALFDAGKMERLERSIVAAVNNAMKKAQKEAAMAMAKSSGGMGGLGQMLGMQ